MTFEELVLDVDLTSKYFYFFNLNFVLIKQYFTYIAHNITTVLFFHCNITMKYSRDIAEILQRYHDNVMVI